MCPPLPRRTTAQQAMRLVHSDGGAPVPPPPSCVAAYLVFFVAEGVVPALQPANRNVFNYLPQSIKMQVREDRIYDVGCTAGEWCALRKQATIYVKTRSTLQSVQQGIRRAWSQCPQLTLRASSQAQYRSVLLPSAQSALLLH